MQALNRHMEGNMRYQTILMAATAAAVLASSGAVQAQDNDSNVLEEIVVTAQKREERLQDVPISITAVTGEELQRRGATSLLDLQYSVPGLSATEYGPGQERVQLRGISNYLALPTVGKYLDEMPINGEASGGGSIDVRFLDMERVEVLRGPQGTLYGEGSMGGTIRYITKNPDLTSFGGDVEAQVGQVTDGGTSWRANATLNLPLAKDRVGLRLVAGYEKQGGWIDNVVSGQDDVNDVELKTVRGKLLAKVSDNIEASLLVLHQEMEQGAQHFGVNRQTNALLPEYSDGKYDLVNGVVRIDLGWAELVNSAGYMKLNNELQYDISSYFVPALTAPPPFGFGLPIGFIDTVGLVGSTDLRVWTDELRLASKPGGPIDWTFGLYGRDAKYSGDSVAITAPGDLGFPILAAVSTNRSKSWSAFGEVGWHATEQLTLSVGARWFSDKRSQNSVSTNFGFTTTDKDSDTFNSFNPRFNAKYEFSSTSMIYANAAKGFRSGGFNIASAGGGLAIPLTFDPETLWTYEVGTKQQWFDRKLIFEGSIYYNDWKDVQTSMFAPGSALVITTNGGTVQGWGIDLSVLARPAAGLTLTATYGWNNMEFKTATAEKLPGDPVDYAVRQAWSASIDYRRPLFGDVKGFGRLDYQHADDAQITFRNFAGQIVPIPSRDLFNARIGLDFGQFEASIFADNLTDEDAPVITGPFGVISQNVEQRPRTVGVNVKARF
jgi:iron complex outermembrane receptor protein